MLEKVQTQSGFANAGLVSSVAITSQQGIQLVNPDY